MNIFFCFNKLMFFFLLMKSIDSLEYLESMVETIKVHLKGVKTSMPLAIFWKLFWRTLVPTDTMHYSPFPWEWLKTNQATFPAPCALDIVMMRLKRMISSPSLREIGKKIYFYHVVAICCNIHCCINSDGGLFLQVFAISLS